jgi:hypothetical protein
LCPNGVVNFTFSEKCSALNKGAVNDDYNIFIFISFSGALSSLNERNATKWHNDEGR